MTNYVPPDTTAHHPDAHGNLSLNDPAYVSRVFDVKTYGGIGDGVADDTAAILAALTACAAVGGEVYFPTGAYRITSPISITTDFSMTLRGEVRGREENVTPATKPWGVFLVVDAIAAGSTAITIGTVTNNLSYVTLKDFTMRGQPLGYQGATTAGMYGIALSRSAAQVNIDGVAFEYLTNPLTIANGQNGPIIVGWIGFFFCNASVDSALFVLTTGTASFGHIECYGTPSPFPAVLGLFNTTTTAYMDLDIASMWVQGTRVINFGCNNTAPSTYVHIGSVSLQSPTDSNSLVRLEATQGSLVLDIDKVSWQTGSAHGQIIEGTGVNGTGTVRVTIGMLYGAVKYFVWNSFSKAIGAESFLYVDRATLTVAPTADVPFANMTSCVKELGSSLTQATLAGTTAGTAVSNFDEFRSTQKRFKVFLSGYENTTGVAQTITFPYPFTKTPFVAHSDATGVTVTATTLTLPASMGAPVTGWVVVEGY